MKILAFLIAVLAITILFFTSGAWRAVYTSGTWRYKLTLVVDDNGKQIVSSSVREVHVQDQPRITPESHPDIRVRGEAVVVDLGKKGMFFALLSGKEIGSDYAFYIVFSEFPSQFDILSPDAIRYYSKLKAKKEMAFDKLPMLVRFRDINDFKTVEEVDPKDLEKTFGKGVKLVSATIEMIDEPVTHKIANIINFITWQKNGFDEWRANLKYGQITFDLSDIDRIF